MKRIVDFGLGMMILLTSVEGLVAEDLNPTTNEQIEFFEKKIRPIFSENCYNCHSQDHKEAGGLRVDDHKSLLDGGNSGAAVIPLQPNKSLLIQRITHADEKKRMPPDTHLSDSQIEDIKQWISDGAVWPPLTISKDLDQTLDEGHVHADLLRNHWAWQPLSAVNLPNLASPHSSQIWPRSDIDCFVYQKLMDSGLSPVQDAGRVELIRRIYFDLTGLPPTEDQLTAHLLDDSPNSYETIVDELLQSDGYAEKWGRYWLDIARYGESTGSARNLPYPHAWRYRDYVINSMKNDKPYDRFIQEQIAGDLLPASSVAEKKEQLLATGFLALGVKDVNQRFKVRYDMDNVDEQIDTVSRSILGLTVSCARCHDHKFDPISTRDYYALAGIFTSTELCDGLRNQMGGSGLAYYVPSRLISLSDQPIEEPDSAKLALIEEKKKEVEQLRSAFVAIRDKDKEAKGPDHAAKLRTARQAMQKAQAELVGLTDPAKNGPVAIGVREAKVVADTEIRIRGEAEKRGPIVPRGFPTHLFNVPFETVEPGRSGRYELAMWLTHPQNPLTTRVAVNRIWAKLFSQGLVRSVDNFGVTGDSPSHPELLDYLAKDFVDQGWSLKKLIRKIVLSRTYQLSAERNDLAQEKDPDNRLLWKHTSRRLEAEEMRDTILSISGELLKGPTENVPSHQLPVIEIPNNGAEAANILKYTDAARKRSVYLPWVRGIVPVSLATFDSVEQGMVTGRRDVTTVPTQALFMLNDSGVIEASKKLSKQFSVDQVDTAILVTRIYRRVLQRVPSEAEVQLVSAFLSDYEKMLNEIPPPSTQTAKADSPPEATNAATANNVTVNEVAPEDSRIEDVANTAATISVSLTPRESAVASLIQSLIASAEFRYVP